MALVQRALCSCVRMEKGAIPWMVWAEQRNAIQSCARAHWAPRLGPLFGCVVAMPPRINGWNFRAEAPEQACRREVIVVVAIIVAVASTIIKLSFQVPRSQEAITPGVVVMQHEGDTIRGQSHDTMRRCEICL